MSSQAVARRAKLAAADEAQSTLRQPAELNQLVDELQNRLKEGGKEARSIVTPVAYDGVHSLSRIVIETGRTHQIRVHMASVLGCPLAGDAEYGGPSAKRRRRGTALGTHLGSARAPVERVMLHAVELTLPHPVTGVAISLHCEPPPDFLALAGAMMPLSLKV